MEDPNQPQSGQPASGQPPPSAPPPSGEGQGQGQGQGQAPLAIVSLICGILGIPLLVCCGIGVFGSIAAIITGFLGRKQASERGVSPTMATIGLILGIVGVVLTIIWWVAFGLSFDTNPDFDTDSSDFDTDTP